MSDIKNFLDQDLSTEEQKILHLEQLVMELQEQQIVMQENMTSMMMSIKETQRYLLKIAQNQQELNKRVGQWPYLNISNESKN